MHELVEKVHEYRVKTKQACILNSQFQALAFGLRSRICIIDRFAFSLLQEHSVACKDVVFRVCGEGFFESVVRGLRVWSFGLEVPKGLRDKLMLLPFSSLQCSEVRVCHACCLRASRHKVCTRYCGRAAAGGGGGTGALEVAPVRREA
eukprot:6186526-Pleurochrysis_carterae.AAC.2